MPRALQFILLFVGLWLLQTLLLDNLDLGIYIHPMAYLALVILLPMELAPVWVLLSAAALGALVDLSSGTPGLNSAAVMLVAFARPLLLQLAVGKEDIHDGGLPTSARIGMAGFLRYAFALALVHCMAYFTLEAATWSYFYLTALRIVLSAVVTTVVVCFIQLLFIHR